MWILGVGEALFDLLPDGRETVGGAPLNFAIQANRLAARMGGCAAPVSRVGSDRRGALLLETLERLRVSTQYMQRDSDHPTGTVTVTVDASGQHPDFIIHADAAWDFLEPITAPSCDALAFGTLAQRRNANREVIEEFVSQSHARIRLFDVNLRQHYYDESMLRRGCAMATALKLNEDELEVAANRLPLRGSRPGDWVLSLLDRFPLEQVLLTRGPRGCVLFTEAGKFEPDSVPSYPPDAGANAIGAGDGAAAAFTVGLLAGLPPLRIVELANHVGAWTASKAEAAPDIPPEILDLLAHRG